MTCQSIEKDIQPLNVFFCGMNGGVLMGSWWVHAFKHGLTGKDNLSNFTTWQHS